MRQQFCNCFRVRVLLERSNNQVLHQSKVIKVLGNLLTTNLLTKAIDSLVLIVSRLIKLPGLQCLVCMLNTTVLNTIVCKPALCKVAQNTSVFTSLFCTVVDIDWPNFFRSILHLIITTNNFNIPIILPNNRNSTILGLVNCIQEPKHLIDVIVLSDTSYQLLVYNQRIPVRFRQESYNLKRCSRTLTLTRNTICKCLQ